MSPFATALLLINVATLLLLPRRLAPLPLLIAACYATTGQAVTIWLFTFTVIRMSVAVGVARAILRRESLTGGVNTLDRVLIAWALWALVSSVFHDDASAALVFRLGLVYNTCGIYFLIRVFCQSLDDVVGLFRATAILLVPVAAAMLWEHTTTHNPFAILGGIAETPSIRMDRVRAQGPFAHSILAGTVGAVSLPLTIALWRRHRHAATVGTAASAAMIVASASSGPIISALAAIGALFTWQLRHQMRLLRWLAVLGFIGLDVMMKAPVYYLIARIDIVGGSTGWHRSRLIQSALERLSEWWLAGTDYTRHWAPAPGWSPNHTDITNHYLYMGVIGGLPLMLLFIAVLVQGFSFVGQTLRSLPDAQAELRFVPWALGASLFAHAATFLSVSYFDQSFVFLYLTLAAIASARSAAISLNQPLYPRSTTETSLPLAQAAWSLTNLRDLQSPSSAGPLRKAVQHAHPRSTHNV
jgi:hypothetical protein